MRAVLYDVRWQLIRINCLSQRHPKGGWSTDEGVQDNLDTFSRYLYEERIGNDEWYIRQYRVNNCINATVMGLTGVACDTADRIATVQRFRNRHTDKDTWFYAAKYAASNWDWEKVRKEVRELSYDDWKFLYHNLNRRSLNAATANSRPELNKFLKILRQDRL